MIRKQKPLILAVLIWLAFALFSKGYDSPDEHFPTLEAAGGLLFGYWEPTWEWPRGLRSWLQPLIEAGCLLPFVKSGILNRSILDSLLRIFNSLIWFWGAYSAEKITQNKNVKLSMLFAFPFVIWGTRHGSDLFCIPFLLQSIVFLTRSNFFLFGIFSAITFQIRFTTGPLIALLAVSYFWNHKNKLAPYISKAAFNFLIGFSLALIPLTLLDGALYSHFMGHTLYPVFRFFQFNVLERSQQFHASPFWEPWIDALALTLPFLLFLRKDFFEKNKSEKWLIAPILGMLILWSVLRHFEYRFLMPTLALAILILGKNSRAHIANAVILLAAFVFYRDPHASQIEALEKLKSNPIVFVEATGGPPVFYSLENHLHSNITRDAWQQLCQNPKSELLIKSEPKTWAELTPVSEVNLNYPRIIGSALNQDWSRFQVITPEECKNASSFCRINTRLTDSLGRQLRKKWSPISSPGFLYDCEL